MQNANMGKRTMPKVCYYKPNRTRVRVFTAKDVRRIAKYAIDDGANAVDVLAGVAVFAGLGWVFCVAARAIDNSFNILSWLTKIGGIVAISKTVDFLLTVVSGGFFRRLPSSNRVALVVILALGVFEPILRSAKGLLDSAHVIQEAADIVHNLCSKVKEIAGELGEEISDKYNEVADFSEDTFERITETEVDKAFKFRDLP